MSCIMLRPFLKYMKQLLVILFPLSFVFVVTWTVYNAYFYVPCFETSDLDYRPDITYLHQLEKGKLWLDSSRKSKDQFPLQKRDDISQLIRMLGENMKSLFKVIDDVIASKQHASEPFHFRKSVIQVREYDKDHFTILQNSEFISVYFVNTTLQSLRHNLVVNYYMPASSSCRIFMNHSITVPLSNLQCQTSLEQSLAPVLLQLQDFRNAMPIGFESSEDNILQTYLYVVDNGLVSEYGDLYSQDAVVTLARCHPHQKNLDGWIFTRSPEELPSHDVVFTIAQYWSYGYFHAFIEQIPRLVQYLPYLQRNTHIKIHVYSLEVFVVAILESLGISEQRLVHGSLRARLLLAPSGGRCGMTPVLNSQLLSLNLRRNISESLPNRRRNSILVIKRSRKRYFSCHNEIIAMLEKLARAYRLSVEIYPDAPVPKQEVTATMFNRAIMVVAPHGAGLSNLLYSEPGTIVIEGLCYSRDTHLVNLCFASLAHHLGMRYYGLAFNKSCNEIQAADLEPITTFYLQHLFGL